MRIIVEEKPKFNISRARNPRIAGQAGMVSYIRNAFERQGIDAKHVLEAAGEIPRKQFVRGENSRQGKNSEVYNPYGRMLVPTGECRMAAGEPARLEEVHFETAPPLFACLAVHYLLSGRCGRDTDVLEVGTGSGYPAALILKLLKRSGSLLSIDMNFCMIDRIAWALDGSHDNQRIDYLAYGTDVRHFEDSVLVGGGNGKTLKSFDCIIFWADVQPGSLALALQMLKNDGGTLVFPTSYDLTAYDFARKEWMKYPDGLARLAAFATKETIIEADCELKQRWAHLSEIGLKIAKKYGMEEPQDAVAYENTLRIFQNVKLSISPLIRSGLKS